MENEKIPDYFDYPISKERLDELSNYLDFYLDLPYTLSEHLKNLAINGELKSDFSNLEECISDYMLETNSKFDFELEFIKERGEMKYRREKREKMYDKWNEKIKEKEGRIKKYDGAEV